MGKRGSPSEGKFLVVVQPPVVARSSSSLTRIPRGPLNQRELEHSLAKQVAIGDVCPISLLPIVDINPAYVPRSLKPLPLLLNGGTPVTSEKSMTKRIASKNTLHDFFRKCIAVKRIVYRPLTTWLHFSV